MVLMVFSDDCEKLQHELDIATEIDTDDNFQLFEKQEAVQEDCDVQEGYILCIKMNLC